MFKSRFIFPILTLFTALLLFTACSFAPTSVPSAQPNPNEVNDDITTDTPEADSEADPPVITQPENDHPTDKDTPGETTDIPALEDDSIPNDKTNGLNNTSDKDEPDENTDNPPGENDNPNPNAETKN